MTDVLVTGANRGIGFALVEEFLTRGARVFAAVRDLEHATGLRALASNGTVGGRLVPVPMDVTVAGDIAAAADLVTREAGGLDIVVNNAGDLHQSTNLSEVDGARAGEVLAVNTIAPLMMAQRFLPLLRSGGRLVNLTMPTRPIGQLTATTNHAFIASRYAHNALTRMIAMEVAGGDRIVVGLWPGYIRTDLNDRAEAATPPAEAIPGVVDLIERLGPDDHGACLLPDGSHFPW